MKDIEAFFDIGYTLAQGFTLGGTFGVNLGPGIAFARFIAIPVAVDSGRSDINVKSNYMGLIGYKFGLINKRR